MGLSAVVFKRAEAAAKEFGIDRFEVDPLTGEMMPIGDVHADLPLGVLATEYRRLGNISGIAFLRRAVQDILGDGDSVLVSKVLYSGSHCGDAIGLEEFPRLRREVEVLKAQRDDELTSFIEAMESLMQAGETERNPIVFV